MKNLKITFILLCALSAQPIFPAPLPDYPVAVAVDDADTVAMVQGSAVKLAPVSLLRQILAAKITDSTTVGRNILKLTNPSAVTYLRINADNTVDALTPTAFVAALSLGNVDNTSDATKNSAAATLTGKSIDLGSNTLTATSAQLATMLSNETGSGAAVFAESPTLTTPILGVATATSLNGLTLTPTTGTFTLTNAKTFSVLQNVTLTSDGTGTRTLNVGSGGTLASAAYASLGGGEGNVPRYGTSPVIGDYPNGLLVSPDGNLLMGTPTLMKSAFGLVIGTNVQAYDANITTWAGKTAPSGTVVGTTDTQTLSGKTLASPIVTGTSVCPAIDGGSAANDDITIQGTSNATRTTSYVNLQPSGGFVGIGTSAPAMKLDIVNAGAADVFRAYNSSDAVDMRWFVSSAYSALYNYSNHPLRFGMNNNVSRMTITATGIGVATTAPDKALEINSPTGACMRHTYNDSDGSAANYVDYAVSSSGDLTITPSGGDADVAGNFVTSTVGKTFGVKSGSNAKAGTFTLVAGAATVGNTSVTANSVVILTLKTVGGTRAGNPDIVPTASTGFVATGGGSDTSTYNYVILEVN